MFPPSPQFITEVFPCDGVQARETRTNAFPTMVMAKSGMLIAEFAMEMVEYLNIRVDAVDVD